MSCKVDTDLLWFSPDMPVPLFGGGGGGSLLGTILLHQGGGGASRGRERKRER
jgi:hypothetical protein